MSTAAGLKNHHVPLQSKIRRMCSAGYVHGIMVIDRLEDEAVPVRGLPAASSPAKDERGTISKNVGLPKFTPKFYYAKRRFSITSKYRHIYGVLNIDEI
jgi:hypothetical protein